MKTKKKENVVIIGHNSESEYDNVIIMGDDIIAHKGNVLITNQFTIEITTKQFNRFNEALQDILKVLKYERT